MTVARKQVLRLVLAGSVGLAGLPLAQAQWIPAGMPFNPAANQIHQAALDTATGTLYMAGLLRQMPDTHVVLTYHDGQWDTLGNFDNMVRAVALYDGWVVVGGAFETESGVSMPYIASFDGTNWQPFGNLNAAVFTLEVVNGELYAGGGFDLADGLPCEGIAKWNGDQWEPVGMLTPAFPGSTIVAAIGEYQNQLVIGGQFQLNGTRDILLFDGVDWHAFGPGILGNFSNIAAIQEYHGDLYVGGGIDIAAGNAGHAIMRWDGQQFHALGVGPQLINGSYQYLYSVRSLTVHRDKLIAGGGFLYANNVPASRVAAWDGTTWCGIGGDIGGEVRSVFIHEDTLWISATGDDQINGTDMNGVAKYTWPVYADTCSDGTIGLDEPMDGQLPPLVWPNPSSTSIHIELPEGGNRVDWTITDALGRSIYQVRPGTRELAVAHWPRGVYFLKSRSHGSSRFVLQ